MTHLYDDIEDRGKTVQAMTNTEFVTNLMEFSHSGALIQLFVIHALQNLAEQVALAPPMAPSAMINDEAWKRCGEEVLQRLNEKYGRKGT